MKIAADFSPRALMEQLLEALGEGEIQDSIVIGFLQYFLNTNSYFCRICANQFKVLPKEKEQAKEPEAGDTDNDNDSFESKSNASSINTKRLAPSEDVVQIQCNPSHYFHAACLAKSHLCPVCHY